MVSQTLINPSPKILGKIATPPPPPVSKPVPGLRAVEEKAVVRQRSPLPTGVFDPWARSRQRLPTLPPQILNPPQLPQRQPAGVLDTLNDLIRRQVPPLIPPRQESPVALDLGSILTTVGSAYVNARYGQPTPINYAQQPVSGYSDFVPDALEPYVFTPQQLAQSTGGQCGCVMPNGQMGRINSKGCCVKKRRRRKRLATQSDIRDLAALKQVLGGGQDLKTWIATH